MKYSGLIFTLISLPFLSIQGSSLTVAEQSIEKLTVTSLVGQPLQTDETLSSSSLLKSGGIISYGKEDVRYWREYIQGLGKQSFIDLANRGVTDKQLLALAEALEKDPIVKKINLAGNSLTTIPLLLGEGCSRLEEIIISDNPITTWPPELGKNWLSLRRLIANRLPIKTLPSDFGIQWKDLRVLHMAFGNLEILPSHIISQRYNGQLLWPHLQQINFSHTRLAPLLISEMREALRKITGCKKGSKKHTIKYWLGD